jgi:hypothetical protein
MLSVFGGSPGKNGQLTFRIGRGAVVVRYLVYTGMEMPAFPTGGFLLLLLGYLMLLAGNLFEGA